MSEPTVKVLFICHGNICRSTMAQCVMQQLVDEAGLGERFTIDSAATTNEEIGMPIHPPARDKLRAEGVPIVPHRARRVIAGEHGGWDYIVVADDENIRHLKRIWGPENMGKVRKLMSYVGETRDVADPWFTRDFDATYDDVTAGCQALLAQIRAERGLPS
ncbi:MAG: low molecular weight phosphotyrosine protein phosphatase [Eggerthellaceae bacterium]|nr:low molecular weight phosphotyrosine protein phosphatase [Eggerthellaceae bacterium]